MNSTSKTVSSASPSMTALLVMIGHRIALEKCYRDLFDEDELALVNHMINTAISAESGYLKWSLEKSFVSLPYFAQQGFLNRGITPGFDAHKTARKLMIKNKIEDDINNNNVEQVVFLSGGYDPRSYMLSKKYPNAQFFELDRGDTRKIKIDALMQLPKVVNTDSLEINYAPDIVNINHNLHLIDCDFLLDDLQEKLRLGGYDSDKKTLFIAEGLTMYLSAEDNKKLLGKLFMSLRDGEEVLLSFRAMMHNPLAITDKMHESSKETFQFALPPEGVAGFVKDTGFELSAKMLAAELLDWVHCQITHMAPQSSTPRGDNYYLLRRNEELLLQKDVPNTDINSIPPIVNTQISGHRYESSGCGIL
jgi:methyltransferase (TIGR00027 family)